MLKLVGWTSHGADYVYCHFLSNSDDTSVEIRMVPEEVVYATHRETQTGILNIIFTNIVWCVVVCL